MDTVFKSYERVIIRTPLWPYERVKTLSEATLRLSLDDPFFREALWLASPILFDEAMKWKDGRIDSKTSKKVVYSLSKYFQRLCTRSVPFGLFASCSSVRLGAKTNLNFGDCYSRFTRLDMDVLCRIIQLIENTPDYRYRLLYRANNSIYEAGDQYRYIEYKFSADNRKYVITGSERDSYLEKVIWFCRHSEASIATIAATLVDDDISLADAEAFIFELIESQILTSNLEPTVVGDDLLKHLIAELSRINDPVFGLIIAVLNDIYDSLKRLDESSINEIPAYLEIAAKVRALGVEFEISKLFQVDVNRRENDDTCYSSAVIDAFAPVIKKLFTFTEADVQSNLKVFVEKFRERYEEDEVELTLLMDTDIGLGFPINSIAADAPLVDDFDIKNQNFAMIKMDVKSLHLFNMLMDAATSGKLVVEIPDDPQKPDSNEDEMLKDGVTFQPSTTLLFRPLHLEGKESYFFEGVAGNCAIDIMGRFGHTDRNIAKSIKEIAEHERSVNPGFIFADILHLPEARTGNLILRPEIYDYQIPFIGKPTKSEDGVVGIDDIMVSVNHRGLVLLRSKRLNKYIIPRLSNSHNFYQNALPVYGFLCSVQNQATYQSIGFRWGQIGNYFKFHPRVVYRNCIVSLAKWKVTRAEIGDILKLFSNGDQSYTLKLNQWRADRKIPEKVLLTQSDNELFVDFENELSVATFLDEVKGKTQFDLKEFIYKNAGDSYPYVCQIAVPLLLNKVQTKGLLNNVLHNGNVNKVLLSGHEVVYFKVYGGEKIVEKLLNAEIVPLIDSLIADGMITTWFFIRYQDPEHHFRIRLFPSDNCDLNKVFRLFNEIFSKQIRLKMLADVKLDTYKRELRRYHGDLMDVSELLFFHDSKCIAKLLELIRQSADPEKYRWLIALINVDYLLNDFAFGVQDKHALLKHLRVAYFHEFNGNVQLNRMLSNKYRASKSDIERMLKTDEEKEQLLLEINAILGQRSASIREINAVIMQKEDMHSLSDLLSSYIHMSLNRIFLTSPRKHELVIYDYLERYYASTIKKSIYA